MIKELIKLRGSVSFIIIVLLATLISFIIEYLFMNDLLFYQSYGEQLAIERIEKMLVFSQKWQWLRYAIVPLIILLRVFYTTIFLYIGIFFTELKIQFGKLFKVALFADFVYVLSSLAKLVILIFFKEVSTLEDLQFTPFSVMEFLDSSSIDPFFIYPLSLLNIFELGYFLVLSWLLMEVVKGENQEESFHFGQSLKLVMAFYGSGLLLWVLLVMFITLNIS